MSRNARERQHPVDYLRHSYYENWLAGLEKLLVEKGVVTADELASGTATGLADACIRQRRLEAADISRALAGTAAAMPLSDPPGFQPGAAVRSQKQSSVRTHARPRYVRGRVGLIQEHHGGHLFPDKSARGVRVARHLYTVRFEARELWGANADARSAIHVDLWEDYLEPA